MVGLMPILILVLAFASVMLLAAGLLMVLRTQMDQVLALRTAGDEEHLRQLFIHDISPREVALYSYAGAVVSGVLFWLLADSLLIGLIAAGGSLFVPGIVFSYLRGARLQKLEEQIPQALDQMVAAARAGYSLAQALEETARNAPRPIAQELDLVVRDYRMGTDLATAINNMRDKLDSKMFGLVATTLVVNREKGGNLPEALHTLSESMKEIFRLEQKLITASAEGRKAIKVIAAMPFLIFLMVASLQPDLIDALTGSLAGYALIIISVLLYSGAIYWLRKALAVEV